MKDLFSKSSHDRFLHHKYKESVSTAKLASAIIMSKEGVQARQGSAMQCPPCHSSRFKSTGTRLDLPPFAQDIRSQRSLGMHCCTFRLTNEPLNEPVRLLKAAVKAAGLQNEDFIVMQHGGLLATAAGQDSAVPLLL